MPIRLIPTHSDPESDLETQLAVLGAVIVGNLLAGSVLQGRLQLQRHPQWRKDAFPALTVLPRLSVSLFLGASLYFLAVAWRDAREKPASAQLQMVLWANILATGAVLLKTRGAFQAPPGSTASVGAVEP